MGPNDSPFCGVYGHLLGNGGSVMSRFKSGINKALLALALGLSLTAFGGRAVAQGIPARAHQYRAIVTKEARYYWGINANVALFAAQFHQESAWNNEAKSYVGAKGLGQFMPATAVEVHNRYKDLNVLPMYSPLWSVKALFLYDLQLYNAIKPMRGNRIHDCSRYAMMLSAYNGGLGWLNRDRRITVDMGKNPDIWWGNVELYSRRAGWAIKENRDYPIRIMLKHTRTYLAAGYPGVDPCPVPSRVSVTPTSSTPPVSN